VLGKTLAKRVLIGLQPLADDWRVRLHSRNDLALVHAERHRHLAEVLRLELNVRFAAAVRPLQANRLYDLIELRRGRRLEQRMRRCRHFRRE
jgi:hypothetical protein